MRPSRTVGHLGVRGGNAFEANGAVQARQRFRQLHEGEHRIGVEGVVNKGRGIAEFRRVFAQGDIAERPA